jgi:hypothetical protein
MYTDKKQIKRVSGITERITGRGFAVGKTLKCGFAEKVYENSLAIERRKNRLWTEQFGITAYYGIGIFGEYTADPDAQAAPFRRWRSGARSPNPDAGLANLDHIDRSCLNRTSPRGRRRPKQNLATPVGGLL